MMPVGHEPLIGLIGLPMVGKTTLFNLLSGQHPDHVSHTGGETRVVHVFDVRVEKLSQMYNPKKTIFASLQFTDTDGLDPKAGARERNRVFGQIQKVDALVWVIAQFDSLGLDASQQVEDIHSEIILHDLERVESQIQRLESAKRKLEHAEQEALDFLHQLKLPLDEGVFPDVSEKSEEFFRALSSYGLFSLKPSMVVLNSDEKHFRKGVGLSEEWKKTIAQNHLGWMEICGKYEMEMMDLEETERQEFLQDLGIRESGIQRLSKMVFDHVGLISFFTVGEDEVRSWTVHRGCSAREAAGRIHSDLERGFIRAEIMKTEELLEQGSEKALKEKGLFKVVGKEHVVEDGDILHIRFNV
ncbi:MAG TPA: DUF933 domain-containing protein [Thermotogota bacterium]|nr:DUF933 domain-containing protein [Thermotogota bacterium]HRW91408.1 DUF933 domain-containing protein [Thermotogota bacterium]